MTKKVITFDATIVCTPQQRSWLHVCW